MRCDPATENAPVQAMEPTEAAGRIEIDDRTRTLVIAATLTALFLAALDGMIITAAMPTIVSDLGALHLYSWAYSIPLLTRAVTLPIVGKLADQYSNKRLFLFSLVVFLFASLAAGLSPDMGWLIVSRAVQGIGAGGIFALIFVVLADVSTPGQRARTLSLESLAWSLASVIGPTLGGAIVTYVSWRWIFFLFLPLGLLPLISVAVFFVDVRKKRERVALDIPGMLTLSITILGVLTVFMLGGQQMAWLSLEIIVLGVVTVCSAVAFFQVEKRAREPLVALALFRNPGVGITGAVMFLINFGVFALFAYVPVYMQGVLGATPLGVGYAMVSLSLGWSLGTITLGQIANRLDVINGALFGGTAVTVGCTAILFFDAATALTAILPVLAVVGIGTGFLSLAMLLIIQNAVKTDNLGVATATFQFARTFGGTVGIGVCGGVLNQRLGPALAGLGERLTAGGAEKILDPAFQAGLPPDALAFLKTAVLSSVVPVFWIVAVAVAACLGLSLRLRHATTSHRAI